MYFRLLSIEKNNFTTKKQSRHYDLIRAYIFAYRVGITSSY